MRKGFVGSLTTLVAGAGLALAQPPAVPKPIAVGNQAAVDVPAKPGAPATLPTPAPGTTMQTAPGAECAQPLFQQGCDEPLCGMEGQIYGGAEYLYWWTKGQRVPALLTTGLASDLADTGTLPNVPRQPGEVNNTVVLFGNGEINDQARSGGRFTLGYWFDPGQKVGVEASFLFLEDASTSFAAASPDGNTVLARPFFNADTGLQSALLASLPGVTAGSVFGTTTNRLWGAEANARINVGGNQTWRADLLAGIRYVNVEDDLDVSSTSNSLPGGLVVFQGQGIPDPASVTVFDSIHTRNNFYGGQLGAHIELHRGNLFADFRGKLALGIMHQEADVLGGTVLTTPGATTTVPGGLLAQASNSGTFRRDEFGIVPELGINLGYQVTRHARAYAGYSVLYMRSDVIRPGSLIDFNINASQIPVLNGLPTPGVRPAFSFRDLDFWAQGVSVGVEFTF